MHIMLIFAIGAAGYSVLEILWRGYTHWTMTITGGVCLALIYQINKSIALPMLLKCAIGALIITLAELFVGSIVNLRLNWNVWDYSNIPLNYKGQICVFYSFLWFLLCIPIMNLLKLL